MAKFHPSFALCELCKFRFNQHLSSVVPSPVVTLPQPAPVHCAVLEQMSMHSPMLLASMLDMSMASLSPE